MLPNQLPPPCTPRPTSSDNLPVVHSQPRMATAASNRKFFTHQSRLPNDMNQVGVASSSMSPTATPLLIVGDETHHPGLLRPCIFWTAARDHGLALANASAIRGLVLDSGPLMDDPYSARGIGRLATRYRSSSMAVKPSRPARSLTVSRKSPNVWSIAPRICSL